MYTYIYIYIYYIILCIYNYDSVYILYYIYTYIYIYIWYPKKKPTFLRSQCFWDKLPCSVWVPVGGILYIYIQLYTYVCINCCLTVETKYLEQFCQQKRLQTSPGAQVLSGFKIQDSKKTSWIQKLLAPGFKTYFLALESWILISRVSGFKKFFVESWILSQSRLQMFANAFGDKIALSTYHF